ncbi:MAG: hypothetical protein V7L23_19450 [Nostoc sp.]
MSLVLGAVGGNIGEVIDIGADRHWVSIPLGRDEENVRSFACFTADLYV